MPLPCRMSSGTVWCPGRVEKISTANVAARTSAAGLGAPRRQASCGEALYTARLAPGMPPLAVHSRAGTRHAAAVFFSWPSDQPAMLYLLPPRSWKRVRSWATWPRNQNRACHSQQSYPELLCMWCLAQNPSCRQGVPYTQRCIGGRPLNRVQAVLCMACLQQWPAADEWQASSPGGGVAGLLLRLHRQAMSQSDVQRSHRNDRSWRQPESAQLTG